MEIFKSPAIVQSEDGYIFTSDTGIKYYMSALDISRPLSSNNSSIIFKAVDANKIPKVIKKIFKERIPVDKIKLEYKFMKEAFTYDKAANLVYAIDFAEEEKYFYIVTDYYNEGSLKHFINNMNIDNENEVIEYFRQICFGIKILHQNHVTHRDINPDNIFVSAYKDSGYPYQHYLVIGDLGSSRTESSTQFGMTGLTLSGYRAPETIGNNYNHKADVYSLGCILYFMLTKRSPFDEKDIDKSKQVSSLKLDSSLSISSVTIKILECCLKYDQNERMDNIELFKILDLDNLYASTFVPLELGEKLKSASIQLKAETIINPSIIHSIQNVYSSDVKPGEQNCYINEIIETIPILNVRNAREIIESIQVIIYSIENHCESQIEGLLRSLNRASTTKYSLPAQCTPSKLIALVIEKALNNPCSSLTKKEISIPYKLGGSLYDYIMLIYIMQNSNSITELKEILRRYLMLGETPDQATQFAIKCNADSIVIKYS